MTEAPWGHSLTTLFWRTKPKMFQPLWVPHLAAGGFNGQFALWTESAIFLLRGCYRVLKLEKLVVAVVKAALRTVRALRDLWSFLHKLQQCISIPFFSCHHRWPGRVQQLHVTVAVIAEIVLRAYISSLAFSPLQQLWRFFFIYLFICNK